MTNQKILVNYVVPGALTVAPVVKMIKTGANLAA